MKETKTIIKAENVKAVDFGKLSDLSEYALELSPEVKIPGKVFGGAFFLRGKGEFQVDGKVFPVAEGSVVRVSPDGKRSVHNNGTEPLVMLCVQYCSATFTAEDATDGVILSEKVEW